MEKLARYKKSGHKIELFYFLANGWLERALSGQKDLDVLARWWGQDDWTELRKMSRDERRDALVLRMKRDLGYQSVKAWPIYERQDGGAVMYYMILPPTTLKDRSKCLEPIATRCCHSSQSNNSDLSYFPRLKLPPLMYPPSRRRGSGAHSMRVTPRSPHIPSATKDDLLFL